MIDEETRLLLFIAEMRSRLADRAEAVARDQCALAAGPAAASWQRILAHLESIELG